ncbi:MAG: carboxypeptidase-like regulatory domain-containing protein, partial [Thermoanaerobaculia bacterium]|nr:carboxypeptidase-like regulatory domain-containing protein [Thermoanaerobaculia bacterium]
MKHRALSILVRSPFLLLAALLAAGCSSDGSPTESQIQAASASLSGSVTLGSQGAVMNTTGEASSGVTVRVQGTALSTTTDASGQFHLPGVPTGNQVVVFETGQSAAPLSIQDIRPNERIRVDVTVRGTSVTVDSMDRSSEDP